MKMFCRTPPRTALDFSRNAQFRRGLLISQFSTNTLLQLPEISLPMAVPAWPSRIVQSRMIRFTDGTPMRRRSSLRPDLMAMQSSPVSNRHFSISTSRQLSGSQPSLFAPCETMSTPRTMTLVQSTGLISHIVERRRLGAEYGGSSERSDHFIVAHVNDPQVAILPGAITGDG